MSTADWALETVFLHRLVRVLRRAQRGGSFVSLFCLGEGNFVSVVYLNIGVFIFILATNNQATYFI